MRRHQADGGAVGAWDGCSDSSGCARWSFCFATRSCGRQKPARNEEQMQKYLHHVI